MGFVQGGPGHCHPAGRPGADHVARIETPTDLLDRMLLHDRPDRRLAEIAR
jgi:hypothetical protein